jgi:hypothetical protein
LIFLASARDWLVDKSNDAIAAGVTNKANGIPQWFLKRDVPAGDLSVLSKIPP